MPNPQNITEHTFDKHPEYQNKKGRPPKIYKFLKKSGYSIDDIRGAMREAGCQKVEDLKKAFENPNSPAIVKVIAAAYKKAIEKGDYRYIREIIEQAIGKPKETIDQKLNIETFVVRFNG